MKMDARNFDLVASEIAAVLPARADDLARLRVLSLAEEQPVVTVVGKYNHGKSRLLNELMGHDVFAVADKRETVALAEHVQPDVRWLDAPGLDADVGLADDGHALDAVWRLADIRLFVHAAKEGELDAAERDLLRTLRADQERTQRQTLFVLTQVDQLPDDVQLEKLSEAIRGQVPQLRLHPVSSVRHRLGVEGGKKLLIEKSRIPALQAALREAIGNVPRGRKHETTLLLGEIQEELRRLHAMHSQRLQELNDLHQRQRRDFEQGLATVLDKVCIDLQPVLEVRGIDHSLVPDTATFEFKISAGKQDRARIQIAYSRACIAIRGHLVKHGVLELPVAQQTSVRSLDTVMVAVMGVSVKYRDDLRRLFFEDAGRVNLAKDFAHYFERSQDRLELVRQIAASEVDLGNVSKALAALVKLESA
jgi:predicted GTPase